MLGLGNMMTGGAALSEILPHVDISDCVLALFADQGVTTSGSAVTSWADQAGAFDSAVTAEPAAANNRPTYNTTHLTFDGSDDRLDLRKDGAAFEITLDTSDGGWTIVAIVTCDDWDGSQQAFVGDRDSSNSFVRHRPGANQLQVKAAAENNTIDLDDPSSLTDGQYYCIMVTCASDASNPAITLYIDGVAQSDTEDLANNGKDFVLEAIGHRAGTDNVDGNFKHILAYDRILTSDERDLIDQWSAPFKG